MNFLTDFISSSFLFRYLCTCNLNFGIQLLFEYDITQTLMFVLYHAPDLSLLKVDVTWTLE